MNERIKEMLQQAGTDVSGKWISVDNAEKFAELIVKKCANIVWDEAEKTMSSEVSDAGYKIIEYFGVAEREE